MEQVLKVLAAHVLSIGHISRVGTVLLSNTVPLLALMVDSFVLKTSSQFCFSLRATSLAAQGVHPIRGLSGIYRPGSAVPPPPLPSQNRIENPARSIGIHLSGIPTLSLLITQAKRATNDSG